jgi:hypothetical protein
MFAYGLIWSGARASSRIVAIGFLMLACSPAFAAGKTRYDALMDDGYEQLQKGEKERLDGEAERLAVEADREARHLGSVLAHFDQALAHDKAALRAFQAAESAFQSEGRKGTPKNAVFFQGVALNEMGQATVDYNGATVNPKLGAPKEFCAAIHCIERSITLGMTPMTPMTPKGNPALYFELGWALIGANKFAEGLGKLEKFLGNEPIDPLLKARAEQLMRYAIEKIEKAKESAISPMCGQPIVAKNVSPDGKDASVQNRSQFMTWVVTGIGYDWNVAKLGRTLPVPSTLHGKGALFNETNLSLEGDWFFYHKSGSNILIDKLAMSYAVIHDAYDEHSSLNNLGQTALVTYCRAVGPNWCLGFQAGDTWLRDDTQNLSNTLAFGPNVTFAESDRLATQLSYVVVWSTYFTPSTPLTTLDGFTYRISLQQSWALVQRGGEVWSPLVTLTAQFGHEWTLTEGVVGDRQRDNPLLKLDWSVFKALDYCSFVRSITLSSSYEFRHDQYSNATFPSFTAADRFNRRDDTQLVGIALSVKMIYDQTMRNRLEALVEYKYATDDSNVLAKAYDDPRILASLKLNF